MDPFAVHLYINWFLCNWEQLKTTDEDENFFKGFNIL